jgi:hypothetical protein
MTPFAVRIAATLSQESFVDPTATPSPSAEPSPDLVNSALAAASPYWLQRAFLGLTGMAIAQWMVLADGALTLLIYFRNGGRTRANEELLRFNSNMSYFAFTILWFSAIYLLAAPEDKTDQPNQTFALARKLLIYAGCGLVLITFFPSLMYMTDLGLGIWFNQFLPVLNLAALVALFFYLWKLADSANDPYLKRNLPAVLAVLIASNGFAEAVKHKLLRADDLRLILNILAAAYFLHVVLRMRKIFAGILVPLPSQSI